MANRYTRRERDIASLLSSSARTKLNVKLGEVMYESLVKMWHNDTVYRAPVLAFTEEVVDVAERHSVKAANVLEVELPPGFRGVDLVPFWLMPDFLDLITDAWVFQQCYVAPGMRAKDVQYASERMVRAACELMEFIDSAR